MMNLRFDQRLKAEGGRVKVRMVSACRLPPSAFRLLPAAFRLPPSALTLIELLVVIVILTTLVAGVIPVLSPNNDTRKISAAARGLQGYITVAQTKAARTGRPHGIAFRESSPGSGVALEVFGLEVPPPFAGFSTASAVRVIEEQMLTSPPLPPPVYYLQFILADAPTSVTPLVLFPPNDYEWDVVPPNFLRVNDTVALVGREFTFTDLGGQTNGLYTATDKSLFECKFDQDSGSTLSFVRSYTDGTNNYRFTAPKQYKILRQPTNSTESPHQLPAGIAIDMQGSVVEGASTGGFPTDGSLYTDRSALTTPPTLPTDSVGIMFSPTGAVDRVIFNGNEFASVSRLVLLLGRVENGGIDPSPITSVSSPSNIAPWTIQPGEKIEEVQERINWLNLDSRFLSIVASNGRAVVSEPAFVLEEDPDPAIDDQQYVTESGETDQKTAEKQIEAAHEFAHEMTTVGGN